MILSNSLLEKIKALPLNSYLRGTSEETNKSFENIRKFRMIDSSLKLPTSFKGQEYWKEYMTPVFNQGSCGACWSFATTSTLGDRFNIQSRGLLKLVLSPAKPVLCDYQAENDILTPDTHIEDIDNANTISNIEGACNGNSLYNAWKYLYLYGTTTNECVPYSLSNSNSNLSGSLVKNYNLVNTNTNTLPLCSAVTGTLGDMCQDNLFNTKTGEEFGTPARFYRCRHFYSIAGVEKDGGSEWNIRHEIFKWGPVSTGMKVYTNFYTFNSKTEIYDWDGKGPQIGGHAIELVGWGEENGIKFWWVKNSWGVTFGDNGYFKMRRGVNSCEIEENVLTCIPDFFNEYDVKPNEWAETPNLVKKRKEIDNIRSKIAGGGIDPIVGYTRRIKKSKPWIKFEKPFSEKIIIGSKFVAGQIKNNNNNLSSIFFLLFLIIGLKIVFGILFVKYENVVIRKRRNTKT